MILPSPVRMKVSHIREMQSRLGILKPENRLSIASWRGSSEISISDISQRHFKPSCAEVQNMEWKFMKTFVKISIYSHFQISDAIQTEEWKIYPTSFQSWFNEVAYMVVWGTLTILVNEWLFTTFSCWHLYNFIYTELIKIKCPEKINGIAALKTKAPPPLKAAFWYPPHLVLQHLFCVPGKFMRFPCGV